MDELVAISGKITPVQHKQLVEKAAKEGISMSAVLRWAIDFYFGVRTTKCGRKDESSNGRA